jgi:hypothetical protein
MLQQQERVANEVLLARRDDAPLDFQRFSVGHAAEREEMDEHESAIMPSGIGQIQLAADGACQKIFDFVVPGNDLHFACGTRPDCV